MTKFQSSSEQLLFELQDRVAVITLNRPEARNALADPLTTNFRAALAWCAEADEVGAVLITGAGSAFCAGGDVKAMGQRNKTADAKPSLHQQFNDLRQRHHEIGGALTAMRKPTIAALPGAAAGAGMAIALACDLRIGSENAFLSTGYARIGLSGDYGIAWLLTRVVGPARAREFMLTCERINAEQALSVGLLNRMSSADQLNDDALAWARSMANGPQIAYGYIKDNLDEALYIDHATAIDHEADRLMKCRGTLDHREAVQAFAEKRAPEFGGH
ncbi:MAG: enoyl-CoA hydratase-related protein [Pseudomonadota bacterium]